MAAPRLAIQIYFRNVRDSRRCPRHALLDIIAIAICAVLCGAQDWQQIVTFGQQRLSWLQRFLTLANGIPCHDTFERVFNRLNPRAFTAAFQRWMQALAEHIGIKQIAIDGKTLRGSAAPARKLGPLHVVSAWASENHLLLGQVAVDGKSNEITAIPELLELLDLHGALVTIDAMGCQKTIAKKIIDGGGDFVLTVKDNQENLRADIQQALVDAYENDFVGLKHDTYETHERGHGREGNRSRGSTVSPPYETRMRKPWPMSGHWLSKERSRVVIQLAQGNLVPSGWMVAATFGCLDFPAPTRGPYTRALG